MSVQSEIENKLVNAFSPEFLEVVNESHMHNVPKGSESHFKVVLISDNFDKKMLVARHKMVYKALDNELKGGVHALALHTYTPSEYEEKHGKIPESPLCMGGNKLKPGTHSE